MDVRRRPIVWILAAAVGLGGYHHLSRAGHEVVVLRTRGPSHQDHFASLWMVDDGHFLWIRAYGPHCPWLDHVRANPQVDVRREGRNIRYRASIFESDEAREYVNALFRSKYGIADWLRTGFGARDTIPIRLEPG